MWFYSFVSSTRRWQSSPFGCLVTASVQTSSRRDFLVPERILGFGASNIQVEGLASLGILVLLHKMFLIDVLLSTFLQEILLCLPLFLEIIFEAAMSVDGRKVVGQLSKDIFHRIFDGLEFGRLHSSAGNRLEGTGGSQDERQGCKGWC